MFYRIAATVSIAFLALILIYFLLVKKPEKVVAGKMECGAGTGRMEAFRAEGFSFSKPSDLILEAYDRVDSEVWLFRRNGMELQIDRGDFSGVSGYERNKRNYVEKRVIINGLESTFISFEVDPKVKDGLEGNRFVTKAYFRHSGNIKTSFFEVMYENEDQYPVACSLINSIDFSEEK